MELLDLQVTQPGRDQPHYVLRVADAYRRGPRLPAETARQLEGRNDSSCLGGADTWGQQQLRRGSRRESTHNTFALTNQACGQVEGAGPTTSCS